MDTRPLLAYNTWLSLPRETRQKLEQLFQIPRTGEVIVRSNSLSMQGNIQGEVTSDGHSAKDLYAITVEKMQEFVGSKSQDFYALFGEVLKQLKDPQSEVSEPLSIAKEEPKRRGRPKKIKDGSSN